MSGCREEVSDHPELQRAMDVFSATFKGCKRVKGESRREGREGLPRGCACR